MIDLYIVKYTDLQQAKGRALARYSQVKSKIYTLEHLPNGAPQLICDGKPYGYVSVSHSDGVLAMAFSDDKVGVDIERADRKVSPKVCKNIEHWTTIEAYAKWTGKGLSKDMLFQRLPEDILSTRVWGEYVIGVCSHCKNIEITELT